MNYQKFYTELIKAPFSLETREAIGELLAKNKRNDCPELWQKIQKNSEKYSKIVNQLRKDGCIPIDFDINKEELISSLKSIPHDKPKDSSNQETVHLKGVAKLPGVLSILKNSDLYNVVSLYLGAPAHIHSCQAWWQYPMSDRHKASNTQQWHRDRDDFREIKLFYYVTDVDEKSGPHGYIKKSHRSELLKETFSEDKLDNDIVQGMQHQFLDDKEIKELGLLSSPTVWTGKAGTCFLEDTTGFHKAYIPIENPRLILSIIWTVGHGW